MPGPRKYYAPNEAAAFAWICEHVPPPKDPKPTPIKNPAHPYIHIPHDVPLFDKQKGRTVNQPLYKLPPKPPRKFEPFHLTWAPRSSYEHAPTPPHTNGFHHHDDHITDEEAAAPDSDPDLALYDFNHQFGQWEAAAKTAAEQAEQQTTSFEELMFYHEQVPNGHRIALKPGLRTGIIATDNTGQLQLLMYALANSASSSAASADAKTSEGGTVLGEVGEDGKIVEKTGEKCDVNDMKVSTVKKEAEVVKKVVGRLKGKARKEAKKTGKM